MIQNRWLKDLSYDPIDSLINSNNRSIEYFTRRDLLDEYVLEVDCLWELPVHKKLVSKQKEDGLGNTL